MVHSAAPAFDQPADTERPVLPPNLLEPDAVLDLFICVLGSNDRPPDAIACAQAARCITIVSLENRMPEAVSASERRAAQDTRQRLAKLDAWLDVQAAFWVPMSAAPWMSEEVGRSVRRRRTAITHLIAAAKAVHEELRPIIDAQISSRRRTWHDAAHELLFVFEEAMRSVYPDRQFGHSLGGPAVRFIHHLLPRVAGVNKTENAIVTALKRG
jgi:hypothetical protein